MACAREDSARQKPPVTDRRRSYKTRQELIDRLEAVHGTDYDFSEIEYVNAHTRVKVRCPVHGVFLSSPTNLLCGKGCPKCGTKRAVAKQVKSTGEFIAQATVIWAGEWDYSLVNYVQAKTPVRLVCRKHPNKVIYQQPSNHLSGQNPCSLCNHMVSKEERGIADFLRAVTLVEHNRRDIIAPKEIDIWLPEFGIAIEFHGLFWHTTNRVGKLHKEKWQLAQQANVRLVQIFEDEWLNKQDIVKNRLLAFLGKAEKRDARKLQLRPVQWKEAKAFLLSTHIQGAGPVGTAYGLYEGETLVAVATFGKSRSGAMTGARKEGEYEVLRYASTGTVRGGFTRLFSRFKQDFSPEVVISYCDLRYGTGGLYKAAGFALGSVTEPDYWWVPKGKIERVPRYVVQKHKMAKPDHPLHSFYAPHKTEAQICEEAGWQKIHGVGNQKWVWELT